MNEKQIEALHVIIRDAMRQRLNAEGYRKVKKALGVLGLNDDAAGEVLSLMEYHDSSGKPWPYLVKTKKPS